MNAAAAMPAGSTRSRMRRALLLLLPLLFVGPSLLPGKRFLPAAPVAFEPLATEHPEAAQAAREGMNRWTIDALFPALTHEVAVREALARGALPLWDPSAGLGAPLAGGTMAGVWYPPRWLVRWMPADVAAGWHALLGLVLAGLGMQCFLERRGLSTTAALIGAFALQASPFAVGNLHLSMKLDAALWLPWSLWAVEGVVRGKRAAPLALAASVALSFLAGFAPIAVFALATTAAWWLARSVTARSLRTLLVGGVALACGVGAAAIELLPTAEASDHSLRGPASAEIVAAQRAPAAALWTLVAPKLYGVPTEDRYAPDLGAVWAFTGEGDAELAQRAVPLEWMLGGGAVVLLLAAAGLAGGGRRALFPGLAALAAFLFVLGVPPASWLYHLPGFALGAPTRAASALWVLLPWLGAIGIEALRAGVPAAVRASLAAALVCTVTGGWWLATDPDTFADELHAELPERLDVEPELVAERLPREHLLDDARRVRGQGLELLALAIAGGAACTLARRRYATHCAGLLIVLSGAELARTHLVPRDLGGSPFVPPSDRMDDLRMVAEDGRVLRHDESESGVDEVLQLARPNLPQLYGVADLSSYRVFTPRWQTELLSLVDPRSPYGTGASRISDPELLDHRLLDRLGVTALLSLHDLEQDAVRLVDQAPNWRLYRRQGVLPFARVVPELTPCSSDSAALALLARHVLDAERTATVVPRGPGGVRDDRGPAPNGASPHRTTSLSRPDPNRLLVRVEDSGGGWLVLREAWYPGWRANVNGVEVPVRRVDHGFRAARVPAGDAEVEFVYRPRSLVLGAWISAASIAAALALLVVPAGRRGSR